MAWIWKLLSAGPLAGFRTYLVGAGLAVSHFAHWLAGEITLVTLMGKIDEILAGLGIMTGRAALQELIKALKALTDAGVGKPADPAPPRPDA